MNARALVLGVVSAAVAAAPADAVRRFEIKVVDGRLVAHGYSTDGDDGGGAIRPFYNAVHDHWFDIGGGEWGANQPGFDVFVAGELEGHSIELTLIGSGKWATPGVGEPNVVPLDSELMTASFDGVTVSTDALGTLPLTSAVGAGGAPDLDPFYTIDSQDSGIIHVLEFTLSTSAPGVADSGTVSVLIAEGLHGPCLELEAFLGTPLCPADLDGDSVVGSEDLAVLLAAWGGAGADLTGDGVTDSADLAVLLAAWGAC